MLLTSDYYRYLVDHFDFQVTSVPWISYYRRCNDLPRVFRHLVDMRTALPKDSSAAGFLKSVVNYACGYFGLHRSKKPYCKAKITHKLPKTYNVYKNEAIPLPDFDNKDLYIVKSKYPTAHLKNKSVTPLLHFVGIIEYGKLQINRAIHIFQRHLRPTAFRILYSNVDNLIVACSADSFEDALLDPSPAGLEAFAREWLPLANQPGPGKFKLEWMVPSGHGWKFVTPFCMFYSLTTEDDSSAKHKSLGLKGLVSHDVFKIAYDLWRKERVTMQVVKRKDKLAGTDTHLVTYNM